MKITSSDVFGKLLDSDRAWFEQKFSAPVEKLLLAIEEEMRLCFIDHSKLKKANPAHAESYGRQLDACVEVFRKRMEAALKMDGIV